jgi:TonB family protein
MSFLIISLLCVQASDIEAARDYAFEQIINGQWDDAVENAKFVLVHTPEDYFLLGLLRFAEVRRFISELNPKFRYRISQNIKRIIKEWENFYKITRMNKNVLQVLAVLHLNNDREKASQYANQILKLDSLHSFAYFILGSVSEKDKDVNQAITSYQKSYMLDTTFTQCAAILADLYFEAGEYDSALVYYKRIPCSDSISTSRHIGEVLCHLTKGNFTAADSILDRMDRNEPTALIMNSIDEIRKYMVYLTTNTLPHTDTFFVSLSPTFDPLKYVVLLTRDSINVVNPDGYYEKPKQLHIPSPQYPQHALKEKLEGKVVVRALIGTLGNVLYAEIMASSDIEELDEAALRSVEEAKFEPAKQFGKPVQVSIAIPITFRLH